MGNAEGEYQIQHKTQIVYIGVECRFNVRSVNLIRKPYLSLRFLLLGNQKLTQNPKARNNVRIIIKINDQQIKVTYQSAAITKKKKNINKEFKAAFHPYVNNQCFGTLSQRFPFNLVCNILIISNFKALIVLAQRIFNEYELHIMK